VLGCIPIRGLVKEIKSFKAIRTAQQIAFLALLQGFLIAFTLKRLTFVIQFPSLTAMDLLAWQGNSEIS